MRNRTNRLINCFFLLSFIALGILNLTTNFEKPKIQKVKSPVILLPKADPIEKVKANDVRMTAGYSQSELSYIEKKRQNYATYYLKHHTNAIKVAKIRHFLNRPYSKQHRKTFSVPRNVHAYVLSIEYSESVSIKGCAGIMQISKQIALAAGLHVNKQVDERLNPERCTYAGLWYLNCLKKSFGRWDLAVWSYQQGGCRVVKICKDYIKMTTGQEAKKITPKTIRKFDVNYAEIRQSEEIVSKYFGEVGPGYNGGLNYVIKAIAAGRITLNPGQYGLELASIN